MAQKTIGIVGTGIMGSGMVVNYLKGGHTVNIWNRTAEKTTGLQAAGAKLLSTPKAVVAASDIIFEVTANDESSQSVWQRGDGILAGADPNKILITSATLSADWIDQLAALCAEKSFTFFDMPLTGGRAAAEGGTLTLLVGGDESKLENLKGNLAAISSKIFHFGQAGSGMRYKLILNYLQAAHIVAFGEALKLAKTQGLDITKVGEALVDRPGGVATSIAWQAYRQADPPLTFSVDWITKDLGYAKHMAQKLELPLLDDILAAYLKAQKQGLGDKDWTHTILDK
jgi:3-hydroxyisobutyrate dehydrogenase